MGFFDWANGFLADASALVKGFTLLACIVVFLSVAIKTRFAIASTILTLVIGGFVVWAVTLNGLGWFSEGINQETVGLGTSTSISSQE